MATITKKQIADRVAESHNVSHALAKQIIQAFLDEAARSLVAGHRLEFRDFGVFEVYQRNPYKALNPKTQQRVDVPKRHRLRFKAGRTLRKNIDDSDRNAA